jgi:hypothetical protein
VAYASSTSSANWQLSPGKLHPKIDPDNLQNVDSGALNDQDQR